MEVVDLVEVTVGTHNDIDVLDEQVAAFLSRLLDHRGWSQTQLADHLARLLRSTLVTSGDATP